MPGWNRAFPASTGCRRLDIAAVVKGDGRAAAGDGKLFPGGQGDFIFFHIQQEYRGVTALSTERGRLGLVLQMILYRT